MRCRFQSRIIFLVTITIVVLIMCYSLTTSNLLKGPQRDNRCSGPAVYCNPEFRKKKAKLEKHSIRLKKCTRRSQLTKSADDLLKQFDKVHGPWRWSSIKIRIEQNWKHWVEAAEEFYDINRNLVLEQKHILVVPGVLKATGFTDPEYIKRGAPVGDLQQWADLVAVLHVLGHNVTIMDDFYHAGRGLRYGWFKWSPADGCQEIEYHMVFADIITMKTLMQDVLDKQRCIFRVIDAYGTEAAYNHPEYSKQHGYDSVYGGLGLHLKQFYTFYPHTVDNSFLGFAVQKSGIVSKKNIALLYGKDVKYFKGMNTFIQMIMNEFEVHCTLANTTGLLPGIVNHGILSAEHYQKLLDSSKVLVGVGQPMESTGAIESLAHGTVFLNPIYKQHNTLEGKPTSRKMHSQVPYLHDYVGKPYVYTIDTDDGAMIRKTFQELKHINILPYVPWEFSHKGMLNRVSLYVQEQDFCNTSRIWPELNSLQPSLSQTGSSCAQHCSLLGYVCEQNHFQSVHRLFSQLSSGITCLKHEVLSSLEAPYINELNGSCVHQGDSLLYSCSALTKNHTKRLCPCRTMINSFDLKLINNL